MTNVVACGGILGLFPSLVPVGGVQVSGRLVADRFFLKRADHEEASNGTANFLLTYGPEGPTADQLAFNNTVHAGTKIAAVRIAVSKTWGHSTILVWHLHLIRLLPFLRRTRRSRVVVTLLGIEVWHRLDRLTRRLLRDVNEFISISDFTWSRFAEINPDLAAKPHSTVHLGIGEPAGKVLPPSDDPAVALMVGRLAQNVNEDKGHRAMILAWPRIREIIPSAELWIVGDGALRPRLETLAIESRVSASVRFLGQVPEIEKQRALIKSRCMALPSRFEGFGLAYLEAMRLGRPCLVSTVDAGREVVAPPLAGLAANPDDTEELATRTVRLLTARDEWDAWSLNARVRYEQNYTARHFLDRLSNVIQAQGRGT